MKFIFPAGISYASVLGGRTVQLARVLATTHEVHLVEIPSWRRPRFFPARRSTDRLTVHSLPPCWGNSWFPMMAKYLRRQIGTGDAVAVVSHPFWQPLMAALPETTLVYDCLDYVAIHCPDAGSYLDELVVREKRLIQAARHIFAVSAPLAERLGVPEKCVLLPNAVPESWLRQPFCPSGDPVLGFHGALYEWLDYRLLEEVADAFPACTLRLVGPVRHPQTVVGLARRRNVELLPQCEFDALPPVIGNFTIGLIPFRCDEVARCADPLKTYEYLSLGKPVLTTVPPVKPNPAVKYASAETFIVELRQLLAAAPSAAACRDSVRHDTWTDRVQNLVKVISGGTSDA